MYKEVMRVVTELTFFPLKYSPPNMISSSFSGCAVSVKLYLKSTQKSLDESNRMMDRQAEPVRLDKLAAIALPGTWRITFGFCNLKPLPILLLEFGD